MGPAAHAADLLRSRFNRAHEERDAEQTLHEIETSDLGLPSGLEVEWLGVSGYRLAYEGTSIYIDPYVSRVPLSGVLRRRAALPDAAANERFLPAPGGKVAGVLVGHTHFDHAVDAPAVAKRFGCPAYGSDSLKRLMALHGLESQAVEVQPYRVYELGPFEVSFIPSLHSKLLLGLAVPYAGALTCEHLDGLSPAGYRCGRVWGIHIAVGGATLYHQGSANLIDDAVRHRGVDVFLAGVAGRNFTEDYWRRILPLLDPRVVVPTHYDNFFEPLGEGMEMIGSVRLGEVPAEVGSVSGAARVAALSRSDRGPAVSDG